MGRNELQTYLKMLTEKIELAYVHAKNLKKGAQVLNIGTVESVEEYRDGVLINLQVPSYSSQIKEHFQPSPGFVHVKAKDGEIITSKD